jgi:antagonist of KipI
LGGRALQAGDRLPLAPPAALPAESLALPAARIPRYDRELAVRVVLGPQDDRFTKDAIVTFLSSPYAVTRAADRMGLRLDGPPLTFHAGPAADILSEGLAPGAIQVPAHGQQIVLLADHQTTGGYAKIATVCSADLWRLGQACPGDAIRFRAIPVAEAQAAAQQYYAAFSTNALEREVWNAERGITASRQSNTFPETANPQSAIHNPQSWTPAAVQAILDRVAALDLTDFTLDVPGVRLHLRRGTTVAAPIAPAEQPAPLATSAEQAGADEFTITAPFIGVFYRAAKTGDPPLVAPGGHVAPDQPLGLIEVMKTFHEVTAGQPARVLEVLAADATPVEYGQPLFRLVAEEPGGRELGG